MSSKAYVKRYTTVPETFVDELFEFYEESTSQTDFVIKLDTISKWLEAKKRTLVETLKNSYKEHIDYVIVNPRKLGHTDEYKSNYKAYMLSPDCFKRVCMMSKSKNAEMVRTYFIEVEKAFLKFRSHTEEGLRNEIERLTRNQGPKLISDGSGFVYIIRASVDKDNLYKIGSTEDLKKRLSTYNSGVADDIEVLYMYQTQQYKGTERCLKGWLKEFQYRKYKEVYEVDIDLIKKVIESCGEIGAKLKFKKRTSKLKGGYFMVLLKNDDAM